MSTAGARHFAESEQWLHWTREERAEELIRVAVNGGAPGKATVCQAAAAHEHMAADEWLLAFLCTWNAD